MSALPPIATEERTSRIGSEGPTTDSCAAKKIALFDHLVGAGKYSRRHVEAQRLGSLEIEHHLVLGRRLHRQVASLLALEDAVDVAGGKCLPDRCRRTSVRLRRQIGEKDRRRASEVARLSR